MSSELWGALLLVIPSVFFITTGELFLKHGLNQIGQLDFTLNGIPPGILKMALNPYMWIGGFGFVIGSLFWLFCLSRAPLSLAYPLLALSYIVIVIESGLFLGEQVTWQRLIGSVIIVVGVVIVGLSQEGGK